MITYLIIWCATAIMWIGTLIWYFKQKRKEIAVNAKKDTDRKLNNAGNNKPVWVQQGN